MKDFLVLGLMPYFPVHEYDINDFNPRKIFEEYIQGVRHYDKFDLRPVGVQQENTENVWDGWSTWSPRDGFVSVSARQSIYHLTIIDDALKEEDVSDCLIGVQALTYDFAPEEYVLVPIGPDEVPESRVLPVKLAVDLYCRKFDMHPLYPEHSAIFGTKHSSGAEWDERLWGSISCVLGDEQAVYALLFLRAAFEHLMFYGDDFKNAIRFQEAKAQRLKEAVDIENSIHNCYKVMEAIYGGMLASDWRRVERNFRLVGVDLQQRGGFRTRDGTHGDEPLLEKLMKLKAARDDRAAHGRIHASRRSTYYELMEYQMLASGALLAYIKHKYSSSSASRCSFF